MPERHDLLLGQIAVTNGFITAEQLKNCLEEQKESAFPVPLGALLYSRGYLTAPQLKNLLLEQKDRFAEPADYHVLQREDILFGKLLVRCGLASPAQVNECLRIQGELEDSRDPRYLRLGEIMIEQGHLTTSQVQTLLLLQRKKVLVCSGCNRRYLIPMYEPAETYHCKECSRLLTPSRDSEDVGADEDLLDREEARDRVIREAIDLQSFEGKPFGRYELLEEIGRGGMGRVYKAWDKSAKQIVAVKILIPQRGADEPPTQEEINAFRREAEICLKLVHPNIVRIHDVGVQQNDYYLTMDFVEGAGVDQLIKAKRLTVNRSMQIIAKASRAIDYAHEWGVIHQDLKPSNIMVDTSNRVFVTDFGLAKEVFQISRNPDTKALIASHVMGTPAYMAPEQAKGEVLGVNEGSDVYALGATLYHMLTGNPPFDGKDGEEIVNRVVQEEALPIRELDPGVPREVETLVEIAMHKDVSIRYRTARELAEDIERFLRGESIQARRPTWLQRTLRGFVNLFRR
jgi:hypothetical protein